MKTAQKSKKIRATYIPHPDRILEDKRWLVICPASVEARVHGIFWHVKHFYVTRGPALRSAKSYNRKNKGHVVIPMSQVAELIPLEPEEA
jgi:hypothetical protein